MKIIGYLFLLSQCLLTLTQSLKEHVSMSKSLNNFQIDKMINNIIDLYTIQTADNQMCRNHSAIFKQSFFDLEPWALKMFDSSSKLQAGFFAGNLMDFGSYKQCIDIVHGDIEGKHCTLQVYLGPEIKKKIYTIGGITEMNYENVKPFVSNTALKWSVCVPSSCTENDLFGHFEKPIEQMLHGFDAHFESVECSTKEKSLEPYTNTEMAILYLFGFILIVELISTVYDIYKRHKQLPPGIETTMSIYSNTINLFARNPTNKNMNCLNGIRVISILFVIFGHRFLMFMFFYVHNVVELMENIKGYTSKAVVGSVVSVDTFLFLGGLLLTYNLLLYHHKGGKFNYTNYILHRYLRIAAPYLVMILIIAVFSHRMGGGPNWQATMDQIQKPCQQYWWSALLFIQNFVNPKELCLIQAWYLNIDQFYYICAPLLIMILIRNEFWGIVSMCIVFFVSLLLNFQAAYTNGYSIEGLVNRELATSKFFTEFYIQPEMRASPYIIGMLFGYTLFKTRDKKIVMGYKTLIAGWIVSISLLSGIIVAHHKFTQEEYVYNHFEAASYHALHRNLWVIAVGWILWVCIHGYGGAVNAFLSSHVFEVGSRLTYSAFLIHMPYQYLQSGAHKQQIYFVMSTSVVQLFSDTGVAFIFGYLLTVLAESPVYQISTLFFKKRLSIHEEKNK